MEKWSTPNKASPQTLSLNSFKNQNVFKNKHENPKIKNMY